MKFHNSLLWLLLCIFWVFKSIKSQKGGAVAKDVGGNCEHPRKEYRFGGNNMGFFTSAFTKVKPAIFPCAWDSGGSKWLKFQVTKDTGPLDEDDELIVVLGNGMECKKGATIDPRSIPAKTMLCDLKKSDTACPGQNIRVEDSVREVIFNLLHCLHLYKLVLLHQIFTTFFFFY